MKRLPIDFADSLGARHRAHLPIACAVGALGLALLGLAGVQITGLWQSLAHLRHQETAWQAARASQAMRSSASATNSALSDAQIQAVNQAVERLNFPWRDLFVALQRATPPTIALIALTPDMAHRRIDVVAESATREAMLAYVEALKQQGFFASVTLLRHSINTRDPNLPVRFQFEATWLRSTP